MKVTRLDRRHNGHGIMSYYVEPAHAVGRYRDDRVTEFKHARIWAWDAFGPGCELDLVVVTPVPAGDNGECRMAAQERWAWSTTDSRFRIYLRDDTELAWFRLKWPE